MSTHSQGLLVIYQQGDHPVEVRLDAERDTVWLSQRKMAEVFDTSTDNISLHLKNIYANAELDETATTEESSVVRQEGRRRVKRRVRHYNLISGENSAEVLLAPIKGEKSKQKPAVKRRGRKTAVETAAP